MKEIAQKLVQVEKDIAEKKGPFLLFALFLPEDVPDLWDLLVAAPWITKNKEKSLRYIAEKTREVLKPDELLKLSRIVIIEQDNPALETLQQVHVEHGMMEIQNSYFSGLQIRYAYIITSRREDNSTHNKSMENKTWNFRKV